MTFRQFYLGGRVLNLSTLPAIQGSTPRYMCYAYDRIGELSVGLSDCNHLTSDLDVRYHKIKENVLINLKYIILKYMI